MPLNNNATGAKSAAGNAQAKPQNPGAIPDFVKTGDASQQAMLEEEARVEASRAQSGKLWRFYIPGDRLNKDHVITFLDGHIDPKKKAFTNPTWYEHTIMIAGEWQNYICVQDKEPCPICAAGNKNALVMGFTVIDHHPYTIKKGENQGKVIPWSRKLFIAKRGSVGPLQKLAHKCDPEGTGNGLYGWSIEVSRSGAKVANIGDSFWPKEQYDAEELFATFKEDSQQADWTNELTWRSAEQLINLGAGQAVKKVGVPQASGEYTSNL